MRRKPTLDPPDAKSRRPWRQPLAALLAVMALVMGALVAAPERSMAAEPTVDNPVLFTVRGTMKAGAVEYQVVVNGVYDKQTYQSFNITYPAELTLHYPATLAGQPTSVWNASTSPGSSTVATAFILRSGTRTATQLTADLESLWFTLTNPPDTFPPENSTVSIQASATKVTTFVDTKGYLHYYEFIASNDITWLSSYNLAKAKTMQDPRYPDDPSKKLQGYLATITSADEQIKIYNDIASQCGWLGGTRLIKNTPTRALILDDASLSTTIGNYTTNAAANPSGNYWYWANGPETGNIFYKNYINGGSDRTPVPGTDTEDNVPPGGFTGWQYYTYFGSAEPNNYSGSANAAITVMGEYVLQFAYTGASHPGNNPGPEGLPAQARWNDFPNVPSTGSIKGYFVEYGGYPGDPKVDELGGSDIVTSSEVDLVMPIMIQYRSTVVQDGTVTPVIYRQISDVGTANDRMITYETHLPFTAVRDEPVGADTIAGYTPYGYEFVGHLEDKDLLTTNAAGDVSGFHSNWNQRIVFLYKPDDYTVTFDANYVGWNSASVSPGSKTAQYDSPYGTLATATRPGYTLTGWYRSIFDAASGDNPVAPTDLMTEMDDTTLYAGWVENSAYKVHYDLNDTPTEPADQTTPPDLTGVSWTQAGLLPTPPTREGYVFTGWDVVTNGSKQGVTSADTYGDLAASDAEDAITLQAQWEDARYYWVIYHLNGAAAPPSLPDERLDDITELVPLPEPTRPGYDFTGWLVADDGTGATGGTYFDADGKTFEDMAGFDSHFVVLEAQWQARQYTVAYDSNDPTSRPYGTPRDAYWGSNGLVPPVEGNPTRSGYLFMGWNTDPAGTGLNASTGSTYAQLAGGDDAAPGVELYAQWQAARTFFVSYDTHGGSPSWIDDLTGVYLDDADLLPETDPTPPVGYEFAGWTVIYNGSKSGVTSADTFGDLAADPNAGYIVLQAQYSPKQGYVVYYDLNGPTIPTYPTQKPAVGSPLFGTEVVWTQSNLLPGADPAWSGHTFLGWNTAKLGDGIAATETDTYGTLTGGVSQKSVTLYAQWSTDTVYTVRYELNGGTGSVPNIELLTSDLVPITPEPTPPPGYDFDRWIVIDNGYGQSTYVTVNGTQTYAQLVYGSDPTTYRHYIVLRAVYTEKADFTVNFDWNYGDTPTVDTTTGVKWTDSGFTPHAANQAGKNLLGWTVDQDGQSPFVLPGTQYRTLAGNNDSITELTLYAQWEDAYFIVRYDLNGLTAPADNTDYDQITVGFDDVGLVPPSLDRVGYRLDGWVVSENGATAELVTALDSYRTLAAVGAPYITLQAQWVAKDYVVHYDVNGGSPAIASTPATGSGALRWWSNNLLPPSSTTRPGYSLQGWKLSAVGSEAVAPLVIAAAGYVSASTRYSDLAWVEDMDWDNITLQAQWLENPNVTINYGTLSFSNTDDPQADDAGGTVSPTSQSVAPASGTAGSTATEKSGYDFIGWYEVDETGDTDYLAEEPLSTTKAFAPARDSNGLNEARSYVAVFQETGDVTINYGTLSFSNTDDPQADDAGGFVTPTSESIGPASGLAESTATLTPGYEFIGWFAEDLTGDTDYLTDTPLETGLVFNPERVDELNEAGSYVAVFQELADVTISYAPLSFSAAGVAQTDDAGGSVDPTSQSIGPASGLAKSEATKNPGYDFIGWFEVSPTTDYLGDTPLETDETFHPERVGDVNPPASYVAVFQEQTDVVIDYAPLSYSAAGVAQADDAGGSVDPTSQSIGPASGLAESTATPIPGYDFIGWFEENPATDYLTDPPLETDPVFNPERVGEVNVAASYVAVFQQKPKYPATVTVSLNGVPWDGLQVQASPDSGTTLVDLDDQVDGSYTVDVWADTFEVWVEGFDTGVVLTVSDGGANTALIEYWTTTYVTAASTGPAPVDANQYLDGSQVMVLDGQGMAAPSGKQFAGWTTNPAALAPLAAYAPGTTFQITEPVTLYAVWSVKAWHAVTYDANGGSGSLVDPNSPHLDGSMVAVFDGAYLTPPAGYHYAGWSTNPTATSPDPAYAAGKAFKVSAAVTLYAVWAQNASHAVTYDANGGTGSVVDPGSPHLAQTKVTVLDGAGLTPPTDRHFVGWSLEDDAQAANPVYEPNAEFVITDSVVLYAVWVDDDYLGADLYGVGYSANGGVGSVTDPTSGYVAGSPATVQGATGLTAPAGQYFAGWSTDPGASGPDSAYDPGMGVIVTAPLALYAVWAKNATQDVTYFPNGGTGSLVDPNSGYASGSSVTVLSGAGLTPPAGFYFAGWSTDQHATQPDPGYAPGAVFDVTSPVPLYAVWAPLPRFAVTYLPNGGSGSVVDANSPYLGGAMATAQSGAGLTPPVGKVFAGWSANPKATKATPAYAPGATFGITGPVTLYAVWSAKPPVIDPQRNPEKLPATPGNNPGVRYPGSPPYGGTFVGYRASFPGASGDTSVGGTWQDTLRLRNHAAPTPAPPLDAKPAPSTAQETARAHVRTGSATWSLVNLVLSLIGLVLALVVAVRAALRRYHDADQVEDNLEDQPSGQGAATLRLAWPATAAVLGLVGIVLFAITQDLTRRMGLVDQWTIVHLLMVLLLVVVMARVFRRVYQDHDQSMPAPVYG